MHSHYTHKPCQRVLLGVFHPCLWPLKAPGSTFGGRVTKLLVSSLTPVRDTHRKASQNSRKRYRKEGPGTRPVLNRAHTTVNLALNLPYFTTTMTAYFLLYCPECYIHTQIEIAPASQAGVLPPGGLEWTCPPHFARCCWE